MSDSPSRGLVTVLQVLPDLPKIRIRIGRPKTSDRCVVRWIIAANQAFWIVHAVNHRAAYRAWHYKVAVGEGPRHLWRMDESLADC